MGACRAVSELQPVAHQNAGKHFAGSVTGTAPRGTVAKHPYLPAAVCSASPPAALSTLPAPVSCTAIPASARVSPTARSTREGAHRQAAPSCEPQAYVPPEG